MEQLTPFMCKPNVTIWCRMSPPPSPPHHTKALFVRIRNTSSMRILKAKGFKKHFFINIHV